MSDKKVRFAWTMYDFANSAFTTLIVTFVYATYFTKAIAPDEISGTALWSRAVAISALAVAVLSPIMGAMADSGRNRKSYLLLFTAVAVLSSAMLYFPLPGQVMLALTWFIIGNIAYEMGNVFYNAYLPEISMPSTMGKVSGTAWGAGYLGGLGAMVLAMITMVNPEVPWFGLSRELGQNIRATNLLVAGWFALFSIPLFLVVKDSPSPPGPGGIRNGLREIGQTFSEIREYRQIVRFLVARLIYNDGLITIFAFGGIYAAGTFAFTFKEIMLFGVVLNITAGIGAYFFGFCDDWIGGKSTVQISLVGLIIASILAVLAPNKTLFWVAGILVGIFSGPNQAASRSLMARLIPRGKENQFFGFFAFSGKFTAFLGPLLLGILTDLFNSQRAGVSIVILFFFIGSLILAGVEEKCSASS